MTATKREEKAHLLIRMKRNHFVYEWKIFVHNYVLFSEAYSRIGTEKDAEK